MVKSAQPELPGTSRCPEARHVPGPGLGWAGRGWGRGHGGPGPTRREARRRLETTFPPPSSLCAAEKRNPTPPAPNSSGSRSGLMRVEGDAGFHPELGKSEGPTAEAGTSPGREAPRWLRWLLLPRRGGAGGSGTQKGRSARRPGRGTREGRPGPGFPRRQAARGASRPLLGPGGATGLQSRGEAGRAKLALGGAHADVPATAPSGSGGDAGVGAREAPDGQRPVLPWAVQRRPGEERLGSKSWRGLYDCRTPLPARVWRVSHQITLVHLCGRNFRSPVLSIPKVSKSVGESLLSTYP